MLFEPDPLIVPDAPGEPGELIWPVPPIEPLADGVPTDPLWA